MWADSISNLVKIWKVVLTFYKKHCLWNCRILVYQRIVAGWVPKILAKHHTIAAFIFDGCGMWSSWIPWHLQFNMIGSNTDSSKSRIARTHCISPALFLFISFKIYSFFEKIQRFNTDSSNCSPWFTKKYSFTRCETNLERLDRNLMFVLL